MSRRRRDHREPKQQDRAAEWTRIEVACTGRGTHPRWLFGRCKVHVARLASFSDETIAELSDLDVSTLLLFTGMPDRFLVDNFPLEAHNTVTFKCPRCSRTMPFREGTMNRRLLGLAKRGLRSVDLSRLDRVRLSQ